MPLKLKIGGSREGPDYRFIGDRDALLRIARQLADCLEGRVPRPWGPDSDVVAIEDVMLERLGFFGKKLEAAFLSFEVVEK